MNHQYLILLDKPLLGNVGEASKIVYEQLVRKPVTGKIKQENKKIVQRGAVGNEPFVSEEFNYKTISEHLRKDGKFDPNKIGIHFEDELWLELSVNVMLDQHAYRPNNPDYFHQVGIANIQTDFGPDFPIKPSIDREGFIFTSL